MDKNNQITIKFDAGTILASNCSKLHKLNSDLLKYDPRFNCFRTKAINYRNLCNLLEQNSLTFIDTVPDYKQYELKLSNKLKPRDYQNKALTSWEKKHHRAVVSLPTGSGKSFLAMLAVEKAKTPTLIIVPTIDLMLQWNKHLVESFNIEIGCLGGGIKDLKPITVTTYDSASIYMEFIGNKYGFLIFDECHHITGPKYKLCSEMSMAPFRLGISATPYSDKDVNSRIVIDHLIGPLSFKVDINELKGKVLSTYFTKKILIPLTADERQDYDNNRSLFLSFIKKVKIDFSSPGSWQKFIGHCCRSPHGKTALEAFQKQKSIARSSKNKVKAIWILLKRHKEERIIIFTSDNETAYKLGNSFFLPVITHKTKTSERKDFLHKFSTGEYRYLVTSKVLNEGVDVPEANIGIVVSGSSSVREHVQRLGRILRPKKGKRAILYELISRDTSEENISRRRRNHNAYS